MSASIEVLANIPGGIVDLVVEELDENMEPLVDPETGIPLGPAVELSVSPELARELAFRLSLAAMKVEERAR